MPKLKFRMMRLLCFNVYTEHKNVSFRLVHIVLSGRIGNRVGSAVNLFNQPGSTPSSPALDFRFSHHGFLHYIRVDTIFSYALGDYSHHYVSTSRRPAPNICINSLTGETRTVCTTDPPSSWRQNIGTHMPWFPISGATLAIT